MSLKSDVRDAILAAQKEALEAELTAQGSAHSTSELNDQTINDPSEIAQSSVELGMSSSLEGTIGRLRAKIATLEGLDLADHTTVGPGALVEASGDLYFVAIACDDVTIGGRTVEGISPESPFAQAMEGLTAGDSFTVRDHTYRVTSVA